MRQPLRTRWLIAYVAGLLLVSAVGLPVWNAFLGDSLGRFLTVEQIHLVEYAGLGAVAALFLQRTARPWRVVPRLAGIVAAVGLADEILQFFLPQRFFQWSDVFLNWAGGLVSLAIVGTLVRLRRSAGQRGTQAELNGEGLTVGSRREAQGPGSAQKEYCGLPMPGHSAHSERRSH